MGSSRGDSSVEFFDTLRTQIMKYYPLGDLMICGDFNARTGSLSDTDLPTVSKRVTIDNTINSHGHQFIDLLLDSDMVMLNGRFDPKHYNFTSISSLGKAVVDYVIVPQSSLGNHNDFKVNTVLDLAEKLNLPYDSSAPDHSFLTWKYSVDKLHTTQNSVSPVAYSHKINIIRQSYHCKPNESCLLLNPC